MNRGTVGVFANSTLFVPKLLNERHETPTSGVGDVLSGEAVGRCPPILAQGGSQCIAAPFASVPGLGFQGRDPDPGMSHLPSSPGVRCRGVVSLTVPTKGGTLTPHHHFP